MSIETKYPKSKLFSFEQDAELIAAAVPGEMGALAAKWNLAPSTVRARRMTLRAYYKKLNVDVPLIRQMYPTKKEPKRKNEEVKQKRTLPNRFARPDFFEENLSLLTRGAAH